MMETKTIANTDTSFTLGLMDKWKFTMQGEIFQPYRPIGDLQMLSVVWSGCCLCDTFPISILNFISYKVG